MPCLAWQTPSRPHATISSQPLRVPRQLHPSLASSWPGMKRKRGSHVAGRSPKKPKPAVDQSTSATPAHPVLQRLYPQLLTLRHYLSSRLPRSSKNRRRKISQLGQAPAHPACDADVELAKLLDTTLVGGAFPNVSVEAPDQVDQDRDRDIAAFTQQLSQVTPGGTFRPGYFLQPEVGCMTLQVTFTNIASSPTTTCDC